MLQKIGFLPVKYTKYKNAAVWFFLMCVFNLNQTLNKIIKLPNIVWCKICSKIYCNNISCFLEMTSDLFPCIWNLEINTVDQKESPPFEATFMATCEKH